MDKIREKRTSWEESTLKKAVDGSGERKEIFTTDSGIPVKNLYTPLDLEGMDYNQDLSFPGDYPYTRGVYPSMYRGRLWTMRQYAGFGTAEETNKRFRYLLDQGSTGLSMAFDLPTQLGYDSTDPLAEGSVGRVGVAVDTLADMETIFQGIPLDKVSTSMTINATAPILLAMYIAVGEKQGVSQESVDGNHPKRHSQGIHCTRSIHLSARAKSQIDAGYHRVLFSARSTVEHAQYRRVSHPRSGCYVQFRS